MPAVTVKVTGMRELNAKLKEFEEKDSKSIITKSLKAAAAITLREAKNLSPVKTGRLRDRIRVLASRRRDRIIVKVTVGDTLFQGDQFYGAFQEFGWKHGSRRLGDKRKKIPGEHYMKYALDETRAAALDVMTQTLSVLIERALVKNAAKAVTP